MEYVHMKKNKTKEKKWNTPPPKQKNNPQIKKP